MRKVSLLFLMLITVLALTRGRGLGPGSGQAGNPSPCRAPATPKPHHLPPTPPAAPEAPKPAATEPAKPAPAPPRLPNPLPKANWQKPSPKLPPAPARGKLIRMPPKALWASPALPATSGSGTSFWGTWVGWIFSSVGAFGGVMAGVGHISVFGLSDYAKGFKQTSPTLNKLLTDSIRTSNQYLVGLSASDLILYLLAHGPAW